MRKYTLSIVILCLILLSGCSRGLSINTPAVEPEAALGNAPSMEASSSNHSDPEADASMKDGNHEGEQTTDSTAKNMPLLAPAPPKQKPGQKIIYLTFDDGPTKATKDILDTLQNYDAQATFFMLEPKMKESPSMVKRIVTEGHSAGLHGVTHDKYKFYQSPQTSINEMTQAQQTLEKLTGVHSTIIRTPYGSVPFLTDSFRTALDKQGFTLWDWNVDSSDWSNGQYLSTTIHQIQKQISAGIIPIVLMHDKPETAKHLPALLKFLSQNGFMTKTIGSDTQPYSFNCYNRCHPVNPVKKPQMAENEQTPIWKASLTR
ncbi:polysaccharide deacetylase family protein [Paenibacillus sp. NPDC058177]|uniref:polysaccharide deacetylase family protein n=1 Tax=Paenibacillus sp. NPDC058177 TaxID=3346369 RepID=UPI0036DC1B9E